jgi:hypothetical protein
MTEINIWKRCYKCNNVWLWDRKPKVCENCGSYDSYAINAGCKECTYSNKDGECTVLWEPPCTHDPDLEDQFVPRVGLRLLKEEIK